MDFVFEVCTLLDQSLPAAHSCAAHTQFFGRYVTLSDHAGSAKLREQLRVEPVVFHFRIADRLSLARICDNHVEGIVDRVVITSCSDRRFRTYVLFSNVIEIRVFNVNLFDNLVSVV